MAKKKKIVPTKSKADTIEGTSKQKKVLVTKSRHKTLKTSSTSVARKELVFNKENYKWVIIGIALITLGMLLMMGGFNENPNEWDESQIYSLRRTLLAPIVILAGLGVEIYAIFK